MRVKKVGVRWQDTETTLILLFVASSSKATVQDHVSEVHEPENALAEVHFSC
jgi:hypothetical protein